MRSTIICVALIMGGGSANSAESFRVTGLPARTVLQIRATPSIDAKVLGILRNDSKVVSFGCATTPSATVWCRVKKGSVIGWASGRFLAPVLPRVR